MSAPSESVGPAEAALLEEKPLLTDDAIEAYTDKTYPQGRVPMWWSCLDGAKYARDFYEAELRRTHRIKRALEALCDDAEKDALLVGSFGLIPTDELRAILSEGKEHE